MLSETKHCCSRKAARASQPQKVAWRTVSLVYCPVNSRDKFEHLSERREGVAAQRIQIHKSFASLTMTDHSYVANLRDTTLGNDFKVEFPTGSGDMKTLWDVAGETLAPDDKHLSS